MEGEYYEIESAKPFSESLIWQLNRDFYQQKGISAWSDNVVPHHMTSNAMVGKTYAELIIGFLKDLADKGATTEKVYILELGAGHGRLAFHILKHLQDLERSISVELPPYCYVLSDIVEQNLAFFTAHPQFQAYFKKGILDVAYFDAIESQEIELQYAKTTIKAKDLNQPIIALANYFFDSLPNDLFLIRNSRISSCSLELYTEKDPSEMSVESLIENIELTYHYEAIKSSFYEEPMLNEILQEYKKIVLDTYLFFPEKGMQCLTNLQNFSTKGLMLISMDKGFHEVQDLEKQEEPDVVNHGSYSIWVNYHALSAFCKKQGGKALFPSYSTFHLDIGCLLFLSNGDSYTQTNDAYQHVVDDFGPDDFNSIKRMAYFNVARLKIRDLIALYRMSYYDSTFFIKLLPRLKQLTQSITVNERRRLAQTLHQVWEMYFSISEPYDLAYELGGIFYDLGFYEDALVYFQFSIDLFGEKADLYYNKILCYYQLRQDQLLIQTLREAKLAFPGDDMLKKLDNLDMNAN